MKVPTLLGRCVAADGRICPQQDCTRIGRGKRADVRLMHPAVSRMHAELYQDAGRLCVRDLKSRTGVRVNGQCVQQAVLQDNDAIEFGPVRYRVQGKDLVPDHKSGLDLRLQGLTIHRGERVILDDVNLHIPPNSFVALLSPSGGGKSTLLKYLAGFFLPRSGYVKFDGQTLTEDTLTTYRTQVGYVPQDDLVYTKLTARENLAFSLRLRTAYDLQRADLHRMVDQLLEHLGLSEAADRTVAQLSGGQRKRVNVGIELLGHPRLLLLDEPTAGLDPANESRMVRCLQRLAAGGTTVICATHVLDNLQLFDHVVVLADKRIDYSGPPQRLLAHYGLEKAGHSVLYEYLESRNRGHQPPPAVRSVSEVNSQSLAQTDTQPLPPPRPIVEQTPPPPAPKAIRKQVAAGKLVTAAAPIFRAGLTCQTAVLIARGLRLLQRDPIWLGLLVLQPLLIGLLINVSQMLQPNGLHAFFLFAAVTGIWLGLTNTAREVVRDRPIYLRERLLGVSPVEFLGSKIVLFGAIGACQVLLLWLVLRYANFLPAYNRTQLTEWPGWYVMAVVWGVYAAAMLLGLLISTLSRSQEAAVAALPLIILPQLLLTGVAAGACPAPNELSFRPLAILWQSAHPPEPPPADGEEAQDEETEATPLVAPPARTPRHWIMEATSLLTISRPALDLLQTVWPEETTLPLRWVTRCDTLHLLAVLLLAGGSLAMVFYRAERRWLEQV